MEQPLPRPPAEGLPNPLQYAHLLDVPAARLRAWVPPVTTKLGPQLIIIADATDRFELMASGQLGRRDLNGQAVFLTVELASGFGKQVRGPACKRLSALVEQIYACCNSRGNTTHTTHRAAAPAAAAPKHPRRPTQTQTPPKTPPHPRSAPARWCCAPSRAAI